MKLVRNSPDNVDGKYLVVKNADPAESRQRARDAIRDLLHEEPLEQGMIDHIAELIVSGVRDYGVVIGLQAEGEFFCMKLRDVNAGDALKAYAKSARRHDPEFAHEVDRLADRAGLNHPECKVPD